MACASFAKSELDPGLDLQPVDDDAVPLELV